MGWKTRLEPVLPESPTIVRYCPLGEVAYIDDGGMEQTFPTLDDIRWGKMVPVSAALRDDVGLKTRKVRVQDDT